LENTQINSAKTNDTTAGAKMASSVIPIPPVLKRSMSIFQSGIDNTTGNAGGFPGLNTYLTKQQNQQPQNMGIPQLAVFLVIAFLVVSKVNGAYRLSHIPGPSLAAWSNIPRFLWVWHRKPHRIHIAQHEKYGDLVRYGTNAVSVGDPREINQIYGMTGKFRKSEFYQVILPMSKGRILPGIFATQDESLHAMLKKPIAAVYSMSNLVSFESYVDSTIAYFTTILDERFAEKKAVCNFTDYLQFFAFDVVGEITFSTRLGFLEKGKDIDNIISDIWHFFEYVAVVGQMPWLDTLWVKNPIVSRLRKSGYSAMAAFAAARQKERADREANDQQLNNRDFLSRFMAARKKDPSIPEWAILAWTQSNIQAGSDTTAIFLRTLFYNLLKHPETLQKLRTELEDAKSKGELSEIVTWKESRELPYLAACINEAGRIHPPFGLHLERLVPKGGATVCGKFLPEGTIVGMNGWVVHRHKATFGEDADEWNPDRWLTKDEEKRKEMERSLLTVSVAHFVLPTKKRNGHTELD
jgi:cytochrome P450